MTIGRPESKARQDLAVIALLPIVAFLSANFLFQFYRYILDSDAAFNFILAGAVVEQHSLFPKDIWFSHDIYLLRPHLILAALRALGLRGFSLYAFGCGAVITACFYATYFLLRALPRLDFRPACLIAVFLLVPLGEEEYEYMLGQQSHLLQGVATLAGFLATIMLARGDRRPLVCAAGFAAPFLLCWDSPLRGALYLAATLVILGPTLFAGPSEAAASIRNGLDLRLSARWMFLGILLAAGLGSLANVAVRSAVSIVGVGAYLVIPSTSAAMTRLGQEAIQYFNLYIGLGDLSGAQLSPLAILILAAKLALALYLIGLAVILTVLFVSRALRGEIPTMASALATAALVVILSSVLVTGFSDFALDLRHCLPGLFALKAAAILFFYEARPRLSRFALPVLTALGICASSLAAAFLLPQSNDVSNARGESVAVPRAIEAVIKSRHLTTPISVYATYWNSSPLGVFLDGEATAAPISFEDGRFRPLKWMSRPSYYCRPGASLLLVRTNQPHLQAAAESRGAQLVAQTLTSRIYLVAPTFIADCNPIQHFAEPTGDNID